ncbi:hypothetical protein ABTL18_19180, partial [Acinetobacter baumannii]
DINDRHSTGVTNQAFKPIQRSPRVIAGQQAFDVEKTLSREADSLREPQALHREDLGLQDRIEDFGLDESAPRLQMDLAPAVNDPDHWIACGRLRDD